MRNIFVHAVVSPLDEHLVEKPTAKAFIKEAQESGKTNFPDYVNSCLLYTSPSPRDS